MYGYLGNLKIRKTTFKKLNKAFIRIFQEHLENENLKNYFIFL